MSDGKISSTFGSFKMCGLSIYKQFINMSQTKAK